MHGSIRTLVNPPTTLRAHDELLGEGKVRHRVQVAETGGIHHEPGSITVTTYNAITLGDREVVAAHCRGLAYVASEGRDVEQRFVLWFDPADARLLATAFSACASQAEQVNRAADQAALEQDSDRREEIMRLGHDDS